MPDFREFFSRNAPEYSKSKSHAKGSDLKELIEMLSIDRGMLCLDMATGTGFTAIELARKCRQVFALDATKQMLKEAQINADKAGVSGIEFIESTVENSGLETGSFDIVTCRRAAHHFHNKDLFLKEARRVLKPGGKLGLVDMVVPETDQSDLLNRIERIRDPSHVAAEKISRWILLVQEAGFNIIETRETTEEVTLKQWMSPVSTKDESFGRMKEILNSSNPYDLLGAGIFPDITKLTKHRMVMLAEKPS